MSKSFQSTSTIQLNSSDDLFIRLAYNSPLGSSSADAYITSLVSSIQNKYQPSYFEVPLIYSAADNLVNGNYNKSITVQGSKTITTYNVPYKVPNEIQDKYVKYITYYDSETKFLFFEIPSEFTYNNKEKASISVINNILNIQGKLSIPKSFVNSTTNVGANYILDFNITETDSEDKKINNDGIQTLGKVIYTNSDAAYSCSACPCSGPGNTLGGNYSPCPPEKQYSNNGWEFIQSNTTCKNNGCRYWQNPSRTYGLGPSRAGSQGVPIANCPKGTNDYYYQINSGSNTC